ncbi:hypothetical protein IV203_017201 [Nitzschia inconspicua]|uniref:Sulfotransferase domain-containing protein n=1 Tax=Nitzschia inconspicua TaxID=303405 RepID=A0A9K3KS28_9STRA|nr:hypothetical protein IV203_017201 [Nitzschia inconspicua]
MVFPPPTISSSSSYHKPRENHHRHRHKFLSSVFTIRRIKVLILIIAVFLTHSTWRVVKLAQKTLPETDLGNSNKNSRQDNVMASKEATNGVAAVQQHRYPNNRNDVPFLPPLPKVVPVPDMSQVRSWMNVPGNETAGQFLLDFAIIGNAKCGTSTIMNWLHSQYPQIQIPRDELYHLKSKEAWDLLGVFYHYFGGPDQLLPHSIKGYKSPSDITNERPIRLLRTYFPYTKLIIGLRHPIYMMESFYNFRIQNGYDMPPLEKLHYLNLANQYGVSWSRVEYHSTLMFLGKTNLTSQDELALFPRQATKQIQKRVEERKKEQNLDDNPQTLVAPYLRAPNPVFLYDTAQLESKENSDHASSQLVAQFGQDMANFLGLSSPLPPPPRHSPGKQLKNDTLQAERNAKKIRICDERYKEQRHHLLDIGNRTATWILQYFLSAEDVFVSNPHHFTKILEGYSQDPCTKQKK